MIHGQPGLLADEWEVEANDFGGHSVRHRHWDTTAIAYVYNEPARVWTECSSCGAILELHTGDPS